MPVRRVYEFHFVGEPYLFQCTNRYQETLTSVVPKPKSLGTLNYAFLTGNEVAEGVSWFELSH